MKPVILIVEDNPVSRKFLKITLETGHYTVIEAADGTSALREAATQKIDLIIQDIFLPDMDGFILNQKLREISGIKDLPILALSGFLSQLDNQAMHSGITTFLLKPVDPSYLLDVVKAHIPIATLLPSNQLAKKGKHILIADDNPLQLKLFCIQLQNAGFDVTTAEDGVIALKKIRQRHPDVIISDVLMPHLDGFNLCLEIKRDPELCTIPVMLLTSHYLEDEDLALARKVGANGYLTRTPDIDRLIIELHVLLNTKSSISPDSPLEVTNEIKEQYTIRSICQLEQHVLDNAKLAHRNAMLMSQLSLISGIVSAITSSSKNINETLKEVLFFCLDATGISKGALYIKKSNNDMQLIHQVGYIEENEDEIEKVKTLFGLSDLLSYIIEKNTPFAIPSEQFSDQTAQNFLIEAKVKSALLVPLFSSAECLGLLFLGSDLINLAGENAMEFVSTLGLEFGQSIALASSFEKLGSSEKRYRQLVEISPDAIFIQQEGQFVYANKAALTLLGIVSCVELSVHSFYDFFSPDYQHVLKKYIKQKKQVFLPLSEEKLINLKDEILDVEVVVCPFIYQEKPSIYMIMRDITQRKQQALHLDIQYEIAWILAESSTLFTASGKILKTICERLQWDCGALWTLESEANTLHCSRVWQIPQIKNKSFLHWSQRLVCRPGVSLPGQAWKKRKAIWVSDISQDETFVRQRAALAIGLNTAVAFPIISEAETLGVLEFFSKKTIQPIADLLLWLESIGHQLGLFLKRRHIEYKMLYQAEHDLLTGLSNRNLIKQLLTTYLKTAVEMGQKLAVLSLDLDNFKYINDSLGHQAGDVFLKKVSQKLSKSLRPQDMIGRVGGDEFIIVIPMIRDNDEVIEIIGRLQKQLLKPIIVNEKEWVITTSIGISIYPEDGITVENLIKSADIAMYCAKGKSGNNFQFCTNEMTETASNRIILQNNLQNALKNDEFLLYYQPKIELVTQKVVGMEGLIRWKRPDGTILAPGSFISVIESSDLIIPVTEWVLETAYNQNKVWQSAGLPLMTVSVNVSVRNLNTQFLQVMEKTLMETNLKSHTFEIELTESVLMDNVENNIIILRSLKEMGLIISIDDFGTGYSSLSYLKRFPIDTLKIDQSFVRDIATDPNDAAIVIAIIAMAKTLGFKVIAEGVETREQLQFLSEHGCDEIQGYYFSRPLSVIDATQFILTGVTPL